MKRWTSWLALSLLASAALAQPPAPVRVRASARFEPAQAPPGSVVTLVVEGEVEPGFHVYGSGETIGIPVALEVEEAAGLVREGDPEIPLGEPHTSPFGSQEFWLTGTFALRQSFRVPAAASGELVVRGALAYQACDEHLCEPPTKAAYQARLAIRGQAPQDEGTWREAAKVRWRARFEPPRVAAGERAKLIVEVRVEEGWHLYGALEENGVPTALTFPQPAGLVVARVDVPPGERQEPFPDFVTHVLPHAFRIEALLDVPAATPPGALAVDANLQYMACTDETCDPEQNVRFSVPLEVEAPANAAPVVAATDDRWEEAKRIRWRATFEPREVAPGAEVTLRVEVRTDEGWHLYGALETQSIPTTLTLEPAAGYEVLHVFVPDGEAKEPFPDFVQYELPSEFAIEARLRIARDASGDLLVGAKLHYMACTEGTCDPDQTVAIRALLPVRGPAVAQEPAGAGAGRGPAVSRPGPETTEPSSDAGTVSEEPAAQNSLLAFLLAAVGAGLFALVMPCTYPMIPITISFFTKQADARGGKVLPLALAYGAGIVAIFVVIGVLFGGPIIQFANHEITNFVIGSLFLVFALSLFGMFELRPPQFLMRAASQASSQGGYFGVFLMGATLVITSFTCTGPFVGSLLSIGGKNLSLLQVALGMGVFGLTMALPFVVLSLVPGKLKALPKSGSWMDTVKVTLGFVELAASLKFFSNAEYTLGWNVLPVEFFMLTWAVIFFVMGYYLLGKIRLAGKADQGISPGRMVLATVTLVFAGYCGFIAWTMTPVTNFIMVGLVPPYSLQEELGASGLARGSTSGAEKRGDVALVIKDDYEKARRAAAADHKALLVNFTGYN